jgi:hypothetical protein
MEYRPIEETITTKKTNYEYYEMDKKTVNGLAFNRHPITNYRIYF